MKTSLLKCTPETHLKHSCHTVPHTGRPPITHLGAFAPSLLSHAELPPVPGLPGQPQLEARLEYSVTAVSQPGTGGHSSPPAGSTLSTQPFAGVLVVSLGCGDVRLIHCVSGAAAHVGAVMYPLRPPAPLSGVRPCKVEAAYTNADGGCSCGGSGYGAALWCGVHRVYVERYLGAVPGGSGCAPNAAHTHARGGQGEAARDKAHIVSIRTSHG